MKYIKCRWLDVYKRQSLAWEMMEMGFMKNTRKVLTSLKPRVSFGITGRSEIGRAHV